MSNLLWASILLCLVAGSAIDTSNICLVRAASNLSTGKPAVAIGILLVTASASVVFYLNTQLGLHHRTQSWSLPTLTTFAGALIFALGSLLNGACAVGTIGRVARGDIGHLATFAGALAVVWLLPRAQIVQQALTPSLTSGAAWLLIVLAFTAAMMGFGRRHLRGVRLMPYVVLGAVAAVVTDWQGNWTWLNLLQQVQAGVPVQYTAMACIAAVLAGAWLTAVFRGGRPRTSVCPVGIGGGLSTRLRLHDAGSEVVAAAALRRQYRGRPPFAGRLGRQGFGLRAGQRTHASGRAGRPIWAGAGGQRLGRPVEGHHPGAIPVAASRPPAGAAPG
jgi:hypothetical protein